MNTKDFFKRLLVPLWLRPERALWDAHELSVVRRFLGQPISQPSLEYGCTEGVNTFILLGGEFGIGYDDYAEVRWRKNSHRQSSIAEDYFNTFYKSGEIDRITQPSDYFEVGISWRESHIQKARRLGIYRNLVQLDLNQLLDSFPDESFATIWAPNLFWSESDSLERLLVDQRRLLQMDGRLITIFPDSSQREFAIFKYADQTDRDWMKDLDRGKYENLTRHARGLSEWREVFKRSGLKISRHEPFIPTLVSYVYDIGLRPMFPVFMNMYEKIKKLSFGDFTDLKQHWIETVYHFMAPLCDTEWMERMGVKKLWHVFELKRIE